MRIASLEDALRKLMNTSSFKKAVQDIADKAQNSNSGPAAVAMKQNAEYYAAQMQEIIREKMNEHQMNWGTQLGTKYGAMSVDNLDSMTVGLSFSNGSNYSFSLVPEVWGAINLPRLLNQGFHFKDGRYAPVGEWRGHWTHGIRNRAALDFLQDAVDEFNARFNGEAIAEWHQIDAY